MVITLFWTGFSEVALKAESITIPSGILKFKSDSSTLSLEAKAPRVGKSVIWFTVCVWAEGVKVEGLLAILFHSGSNWFTNSFVARLVNKIPESLIVFPAPLEVITLSEVVKGASAITSPNPESNNFSSISALL